MIKFREVKPKEIDGMIKEHHASKKKVYPKISLDLTNLPEAKKWSIGTTYHIALKLKQTGIRQDEYDNSAQFEIIGIHVMDGMENKEHMPMPKKEKMPIHKELVRYAKK